MSTTRRELLTGLAAVAAAGAVKADVQVVDSEPRPLLAVLRIKEHKLSAEQVRAIHRSWEQLWTGPERIPLLVLDRGIDLTIEVDPREK